MIYPKISFLINLFTLFCDQPIGSVLEGFKFIFALPQFSSFVHFIIYLISSSTHHQKKFEQLGNHVATCTEMIPAAACAECSGEQYSCGWMLSAAPRKVTRLNPFLHFCKTTRQLCLREHLSLQEQTARGRCLNLHLFCKIQLRFR